MKPYILLMLIALFTGCKSSGGGPSTPSGQSPKTGQDQTLASLKLNSDWETSLFKSCDSAAALGIESDWEAFYGIDIDVFRKLAQENGGTWEDERTLRFGEVYFFFAFHRSGFVPSSMNYKTFVYRSLGASKSKNGKKQTYRVEHIGADCTIAIDGKSVYSKQILPRIPVIFALDARKKGEISFAQKEQMADLIDEYLGFVTQFSPIQKDVSSLEQLSNTYMREGDKRIGVQCNTTDAHFVVLAQDQRLQTSCRANKFKVVEQISNEHGKIETTESYRDQEGKWQTDSSLHVLWDKE